MHQNQAQFHIRIESMKHIQHPHPFDLNFQVYQASTNHSRMEDDFYGVALKIFQVKYLPKLEFMMLIMSNLCH